MAIARDSFLINSTGLRYFAGVARVGSIRRAAEDLHVAASAISRQIHLLEEDLGSPLFERHRGQKVMKLTPAGEVLLVYARSVENGLDQVRTDIRSIETMQRGTVRLGISESFTREFLPQFLRTFHTQYPGINFEVVVAGGAKLMEQLSKDELDISLSYISPDTFDVTVVEQRFIKPCLLVSGSHPFAKRAFVDISECGDEEMALPDETLTIRGSYVRMFAKAKIKPRGVMVTNSFELMRASAAAGLCVAIVNKYFGGPKPPRGLKYVPLRGKGVEKWPLNICVHTDRNLPVAVRIFLEHLQEAVRRATADD